MTQTPEISAELQLAQQLISSHLPIFEERGFSYLGIQMEESKVTADSIVFLFRNPETGIQVRIAYSPPFRDMRRMFIVTIENASGEPFYVSQHLKSHGRQDLLGKFSDHEHTSVQEFWRSFFDILQALFCADLKDIVNGKKWEETPFDWGEYR